MLEVERGRRRTRGWMPVLLGPQSRTEAMEANYSLKEGPWQNFKDVIMQVRQEIEDSITQRWSWLEIPAK